MAFLPRYASQINETPRYEDDNTPLRRLRADERPVSGEKAGCLSWVVYRLLEKSNIRKACRSCFGQIVAVPRTQKTR